MISMFSSVLKLRAWFFLDPFSLRIFYTIDLRIFYTESTTLRELIITIFKLKKPQEYEGTQLYHEKNH